MGDRGEGVMGDRDGGVMGDTQNLSKEPPRMNLRVVLLDVTTY